MLEPYFKNPGFRFLLTSLHTLKLCGYAKQAFKEQWSNMCRISICHTANYKKSFHGREGLRMIMCSYLDILVVCKARRKTMQIVMTARNFMDSRLGNCLCSKGIDSCSCRSTCEGKLLQVCCTSWHCWNYQSSSIQGLDSIICLSFICLSSWSRFDGSSS